MNGEVKVVPETGGGRAAMAGVMASLALFTLTILWSFSAPLLSSPDEPHHIVKAVAVWRGEWLGTHSQGMNSATMTVLVPQTFARAIGNFDCYRQRPQIPAGCAKKVVASVKIVPARTHVGRYPPFYYLLIGWPSLLSVSEATMRWIRVISALWNSAVLGFAVFLVRRFRMGAGVLVGLCCALTPVAIFMDSTVQPNGLEASLGLLVAISIIGLARFSERTPDLDAAPPRLLVSSAGASVSALVLVRGLSPLWLACLGVVALILVPSARWRRWLRLTSVRLWLGVVAVCSALAIAWIIGADTLAIQPWPLSLNTYQHVSDWREIQLVLGRNGLFAEQMVGAITKDSRIPVGGFVLAFVVLSVLIIAGFVRATARQRVALGFSLLATALIPVALAAPRIRPDGINWQGRYTMPFAVMIVLMAAMAAFGSGRSGTSGEREARAASGSPPSGPRMSRQLGRVAAAVVGWTFLLEGVLYWCMLRRYTVSTNGPYDLLSVTHPDWSPVLPLPLLAAAVPLLLAGIALFFARLLPRCEYSPDAP